MTQHQLNKIKLIAKAKMATSLDPLHDFDHVDRVRKNALIIIKVLRLKEKIDERILQAACLLHDLTFTEHKPSFKTYFREGRIMENKLKEILNKMEMKKKEIQHIIDAVIYHTFAFPFRRLNRKRSIYAQILQDADTIDFFNKKRIKKLSLSEEKFWFYKSLSVISRPALEFGRRNIEKFLNFPSLARDFEY